MKTRFKILFHDAGHILIESETRGPEIAHILNYTSDGSDIHCSCESSHEGGNKDCKHVREFRPLLKLASGIKTK